MCRSLFFISMNERKIDPLTGDIVLDGTSVKRTASFAESVLQTVRSYISTFQGECFTDENAGVPWFDGVLGKGVAFADYARQVVREKILEVPGVKRVKSASIDISGRNISGKFSIVLDDGQAVSFEV